VVCAQRDAARRDAFRIVFRRDASRHIYESGACSFPEPSGRRFPQVFVKAESSRVWARATLALLTVTAIAALLALLVAPRPARADGCDLASISASSQPACWRPFSAHAPFNTALPPRPALAANDHAVRDHMSAYDWTFGESSSGFSVGSGSRPLFFAHASDPLLKVVCANAEGHGSCKGRHNQPISRVRIRVPRGAAPDNNWDGHLAVVETSSGDEYDFWRAKMSGDVLYAGTMNIVDVNHGNGTDAGGDAAGFGLTAGLLRPSELLSGTIDHALTITVPCTNATGHHVGYTWPANGGWGEHCGEYWHESERGAPELGQLYRLNMSYAQIARSGAPAWEQTIMRALARYGAYIEDTNGSSKSPEMSVVTQSGASWTDLGLHDQWASVARHFGSSGTTLNSNVAIPVSALEVVNPCVPRGTCPNASGRSSRHHR
jgi:hypothetical protein